MSSPDPQQLSSGTPVQGIPVDIEESTERWSDILLADGTRIRAKAAVVSAQRLDNVFDENGNPVYVLNSQVVTRVASSPERLRKQN
jgi:hypothetical protein